jgi:hypothetical protein
VRDDQTADRHDRHRLSRLLADLVSARLREQRLSQQRAGSTDALDAARADTLQALNDYAGAIEALSWPVPRGIQLEIQLHESLRSHRRSF